MRFDRETDNSFRELIAEIEARHKAQMEQMYRDIGYVWALRKGQNGEEKDVSPDIKSRAKELHIRGRNR